MTFFSPQKDVHMLFTADRAGVLDWMNFKDKCRKWNFDYRDGL